MNDLISRQAAIDAVADLYWMDERLLNFKKEIDATFDKIKALPSADSVKHGKWLNTSTDIPKLLMNVCSECGFQYPSAIRPRFNYCPNCGAREDL